ncbi:alkaline phosphatase family protein [uncultured Shewanella sp.]|uniref:alkaline phosphatase family protein n=1 Tax=uncultured Shewanella sp. TaxID=173975 RepID=UPI0026151CFA|nr:alkaline phosphatase family protein [uncultured Shewanella sp.]
MEMMTRASAIKRISLIMLALTSSHGAHADIGNAPLIGGLVNSSEIFKNQIVSSLSYSTKFARDMSLFTIGGMTLETYILTLPLEGKVKKRVMGQLANPSYSIPLGYFLYYFYDRYTNISSGDAFKKHLQTQYSHQTLTAFEHSLLQFSQQAPFEQKAINKPHSKGLQFDRKLIAAMITVYDALVQIDEWQKMDRLPAHYTYLSHSNEDLALIAKIQPIVIRILKQVTSDMDEGETKQSLLKIISNDAPKQVLKPDNKAQALTITLIDFVRLNVLKAYRQFVYQDEKQQRLNQWLQTTFDKQPKQVIAFLQSQQKRRIAVQLTVDGLQQGLIQGLITPNSPFIAHAYQQDQNRLALNSPIAQGRPQHQPTMGFLHKLSEQTYHDLHYLPFFKGLYHQYSNSIAQFGIASTPTISVRNLPIIKTGAKVAGKQGTGIPNFHFVDRDKDRAYYFFGNDALQLDKLLQVNDVQTMFDRLIHLKTLNCNAQYDWNAHTSYDGLINLGTGEQRRDFGEKRCLRELNERAKVEPILNKMRQSLIDNILTYLQISPWSFYTKLTRQWKIQQDIESYSKLDAKGIPDYTLVYNPWPDHFAHFVGPFSDEIIMPTGELNRLDYWITQIEKAYRQAGVYDQTLWGMAGDHGLAPVYYTLNPEKLIFPSIEAKLGYPLTIKKISSDEGEGPKITHALKPSSNKNSDAVIASTAGGNFMIDLFNAQQGWATQPVYKELIQWTPITAKHTMSVDMIEETLNALGDTLDYMVVREKDCNENTCHIRLIGNRLGQRHDEVIINHNQRFYYGAINDKNAFTDHVTLLDVQSLNPYQAKPDKQILTRLTKLRTLCILQALPEDSNTWCNAKQWRELTQWTPRPDSIVQLAQLYASERAGTINLFPREGIGYNTKVPGRHAGESYLEKDAFIGFWGSPIGSDAIPLLSEANGSLAPTLFEYLTKEPVKVGENGWGYPSLLHKLDITIAH